MFRAKKPQMEDDDFQKRKKVFIVSVDDTSRGDSFTFADRSNEACARTKETGLTCCNCSE